ncbi:hypothetical protein C2W62_45945 [Candidatus Entotheonella serta]|nr:hypothetical protein C2W62_45945 [Candidatus Entotheonella serta]
MDEVEAVRVVKPHQFASGLVVNQRDKAQPVTEFMHEGGDKIDIRTGIAVKALVESARSQDLMVINIAVRHRYDVIESGVEVRIGQGIGQGRDIKGFGSRRSREIAKYDDGSSTGENGSRGISPKRVKAEFDSNLHLTHDPTAPDVRGVFRRKLTLLPQGYAWITPYGDSRGGVI